ncbi:MAG: hypothetical protein AB3N64_04805 [Puniceicoccaceae bacterium]
MALESALLFFGFIKSIGGPRTLIILALGLVLGGILVFQYFHGKKADERRQTLAAGGDPAVVENKRKDSLIAGFGLAIVISFLVIAILLVYLLAE